MFISVLYRLNNTVVFYEDELSNETYELYREGVIAKQLFGYDITGNQLSLDDTLKCLWIIKSRLIGDTKAEWVLANLQLVDTIIAIVRAEMVDLPNGISLLAKLGNVVSTLKTGMFASAADAALAIEPDEFFTKEKLQIYRNMLLTSDSIH